MATPFSHLTYDLAVVGGGIVGLATAREYLNRYPGQRVVLVEKESRLAAHQSSHNSGVIHAGIYYKPGSLKARLGVAGHAATIRYCEERGLPYRRCGKVIVALDESEIPRLQTLYERGQQNGVAGLEMISSQRLRELEPHAAGVQAIYSPNTGVVDYAQVAHSFAADFRAAGGEIVTGCKVNRLISEAGRQTIAVTTSGDLRARRVITCAGLQSDRLSSSDDGERELRIVPFRGSYYTLRPDRRHLVNALIYPVPDPRFPFLGVHFTPTMDGEVWVGPNAVLAFAREGYRRGQFNPADLFDTLSYPGFWRLALRYWRMGAVEMFRDAVKTAYVTEARRYLPDLHAGDLLPGPSGIRAQALLPDGSLADDFRIRHTPGAIHVQNAPSPAATAALPIAAMIVDEAVGRFDPA